MFTAYDNQEETSTYCLTEESEQLKENTPTYTTEIKHSLLLPYSIELCLEHILEQDNRPSKY